MTVELIEISIDNWQEAIKLDVKKDQKSFVASNVFTIAESKFYPTINLFGIMNDNKLVGLVSFATEIDFFEIKANSAFVFRFMIDQKYQRMGIGQEAMRLLIGKIKSEKKSITSVHLSVVPENSNAKRFYEKLGFHKTGKKVFDEEEYFYKL